MTDRQAGAGGDPADHFGEPVAARYDAEIGRMASPDVVGPTVDRLVELADGGRVLEFAIGTGRVALPLADRGVDVHGLELSSAMVAQLRAKPGGAELPVTLGDMATTRVPGSFSLVLLVFNTIMNLTSQDAQVACFRNAATHLAPGGRFLVEVGVPQLQRLPPGETVRPFHVEEDKVGFDEYDVVGQGLVSHHVTLAGGTSDHRAIPFRYVWPAELDLMARLAGMRLRHRWGGWQREPFTADCRSHVSVWEKPGNTSGKD